MDNMIRNIPNAMSEIPIHSHTATPPAIGLERNMTAKIIVIRSIRIIHTIPAPLKDDKKQASAMEFMALTRISMPTVNINAVVNTGSGRKNSHAPATISNSPSARLQPQLELNVDVKPA
jgi:hypothetical protein